MSLRCPLMLVSCFALSSCHSGKEARGEEGGDDRAAIVAGLEAEVVELRQKLLEQENTRYGREVEQRALFAEMKGLVHSLRDEIGSLESKLSRQEALRISAEIERRALVKGRPELAEPNHLEVQEGGNQKPDAGEDLWAKANALSLQEARENARQAAVGEKIDHLLTLSDEEFFDLEIIRVSDLGVTFRHRIGVTRVPFSNLPESWGERFFHDPKRSKEAEIAENLAQARREQEIDRQMREQLELELEAAENDRLVQLAQAVEDLRREQEDNRQLVFANPPVFAWNQLGGAWWNGFLCPPVNSNPVVCPPTVDPSPVICPPVIRQPHLPLGLNRVGNGTKPSSPVVAPIPTATPRRTVSTVNRGQPAIQRIRPSTVVRPTSRSTSAGISRGVTSRPATRVTRPTTTSPTRSGPTIRATPSRGVIRRPR